MKRRTIKETNFGQQILDPVTINLPTAILDYIDEVSKAELSNKSAWIRAAIIAKLRADGALAREVEA